MIKNTSIRQSRPWQDSLAHGTLFSGDPIICQRYYGWAIQRLGFMLKTHPGTLTSHFFPGPDVLVRVSIRPNHIYIQAQSIRLYLESGYLDIGSSAPCNEATYLPARLKYNAAQASYIYSTATPIQGEITRSFQGQQLPDGYQSQAIGGLASKRVDVITDPCQNTYDAGGYYNDPKMIEKKKLQQQFPSSMFTGKTRLFVQALYGSLRDDYGIIELADVGSFFTVSGGFLMSHTLFDNTWVVTTPTYDYFIAKFKGSAIEFYEMTLSDDGIALRDAMLAEDDFSPASERTRRIEAYILSTAKIKIPRQSIIYTTGDSVLGQPMAYGWHTKWDGLTAEIVCLDGDENLGIYENRQYHLVITPELISGVYRFTVSVSQVGSTANWWPIYGRSCPIFPVMAGQDSGMYPYPKIGVGGGFPDGTYQAPVYAYYEDDELQVISLYYYKISGRPLNEVISYEWVEYPDSVGGDATLETVTVGPGGGGLARFKLLKNGSMISYSTEAGATTFRREKYVMTVAPQSVGTYYTSDVFRFGRWLKGGAGFAEWMVNNGYWERTPLGVYTSKTTETDTYIDDYVVEMFYGQYEFRLFVVPSTGSNGSIFFEIPYQDCEQFWYGETYSESYINKTITYYNPIGNADHHFDVFMRRRSKVGPPTTTYSYILSSPIGDFWTPNTGSGGGSYYSAGPLNGTDAYTKITDSRADPGDNLVYDTSRSYNFHFNANPADDPIPLEPWRSNTTGIDYWYNFQFGGETLEKNFNFAGNSAVGWA